MSVKVMGRVWAQSSRKDGELLVMLALADFSNDLGECWPGLDTLAQKARLTKSQVCRVLKNLEETGEIRRARSRGGKSGRTHYFILSQDNSVIMRQSQYNSVLDATHTVAPMRQSLNHHRITSKRGCTTPSSNPDQISPAGFLELYASCAPSLPQPRQVTNGRMRKVGQRLKTHPSRDFWRDVFSKANQTPFLKGENDRGWKADLDWFVKNDENAVKVLEEKYDRGKAFGGKPEVDPWDAYKDE